MAWEPWTGCYKISDGCTYCYYYGLYSKYYGCNKVTKTSDFYKHLEKVYMPRKKVATHVLLLIFLFLKPTNGVQRHGASLNVVLI